MPRPKTPNRGAADIIPSAVRKVTRMQTQAKSRFIDGDILKNWLRDWDLRASAKAGGLGRKKASK